MDVTIQLNIINLLFILAAFLTFTKLLGLMCFEVGIIQAKNTNDILAKNISIIAFSIVLFCLVTHQLLTRPGHFHHYLPDYKIAFIKNLFSHPKLSYLFLQMFFSMIPLAIVIGITAERLKFWALFFFAIFMSLLIYPTAVFWVWGKGFLNNLGFIDIGGVSIMHLTGASAGAVALFFLGPRRNRFTSQQIIGGCNMPISTLGFGFIWLGFLGVNLGASLLNYTHINITQLIAILFNTCLAGASSLIISLIICRLIYGIIDISLVINGTIAGLIAISAAPLSPNLGSALIIGGVAGILCLISIVILNKLKIDDPIGGIAAHGVGAIWGLLAVVFSHNYQFIKKNDLTMTYGHELLVQSLGIITILTWTLVTSFILWTLIRYTIGIRIKPDDEYKGLDILTCGISAYPEFISSAVEK